jgi:hypothetical protein
LREGTGSEGKGRRIYGVRAGEFIFQKIIEELHRARETNKQSKSNYVDVCPQ